MKDANNLTRRERQIVDILCERGQATANEVLERLPDPPSYSAVRALLRLLEEKGHIKHTQDGPRYVYRVAESPTQMRRAALRQVLRTFFRGSIENAVAALVDGSVAKLSREELDRIAERIEQAKKEGR